MQLVGVCTLRRTIQALHLIYMSDVGIVYYLHNSLITCFKLNIEVKQFYSLFRCLVISEYLQSLFFWVGTLKFQLFLTLFNFFQLLLVVFNFFLTLSNFYQLFILDSYPISTHCEISGYENYSFFIYFNILLLFIYRPKLRILTLIF